MREGRPAQQALKRGSHLGCGRDDYVQKGGRCPSSGTGVQRKGKPQPFVGETRRGFTEEVTIDGNRTGRQVKASNRRVESQQRHGDGRAWDMPGTLRKPEEPQRRPHSENHGKTSGLMLLFSHGPHCPGGPYRKFNSWICLYTATGGQMTLSESGLPLSPVCLHPDLLPNSGHCMGKDTGNERRLLPLVGWQGVPCLRAASGVQFVIPPLCTPGQSQHRGAVLPEHPTPAARIPHVGQASPSPSASPGQCREAWAWKPSSLLGKRSQYFCEPQLLHLLHGRGCKITDPSLPSAMCERTRWPRQVHVCWNDTSIRETEQGAGDP